MMLSTEAIRFGGMTISALPRSIAAAGMSKLRELLRSCAKVNPPAALIARNPLSPDISNRPA